MMCEEDNCNYEVWYNMWWFDCKLFGEFNMCCCVMLMPCKIMMMIPWGMVCIPGYKGFVQNNKRYKLFNVYHI